MSANKNNRYELESSVQRQRRVRAEEREEQAYERCLARLLYRELTLDRLIEKEIKKRINRIIAPFEKVDKEYVDQVKSGKSSERDITMVQIKGFSIMISVVIRLLWAVGTLPKTILMLPKVMLHLSIYFIDTIFCDIVYGITDTEVKKYKKSRHGNSKSIRKIYRESSRNICSYNRV